MCDTKPCDNCCHEEDLICCMPMMHCCGGYSEHNNCCPHDRCCNHPCCGGCCNPCCCYCKYYKLLQELRDKLAADEDRITNLESSLEYQVEYLKGYIDSKYIDLLTKVPVSVSYKTINGVKTFVYTRFIDEDHTEDVKIVDINQIKDDLAIEYMNDVLAYTNFNSFPINGEYSGADDVIYIDKSANKVYWYDKNASGTGRDKYKLFASTSYNDLGNKPVLNTNNNSAQSVNSAETITGTINLHKVAKTGSYSDLLNKPTLGTAAAKDVPSSGNASTTQVVMGNDSRLTDTRDPKSHTHTISDITNFPTNVSYFTNDANYITQSQLSSAITASIGGNTYNTMQGIVDAIVAKILWELNGDGKVITKTDNSNNRRAAAAAGFYDTTVS